MSITFFSEDTIRNYEFQWLEEHLKELSNGRYCILRKDKKEWYSIISDKEWDRIKFHFELRWKQGFYITEVSNINIRIHLESQYASDEIDKMAREYLANNKCLIVGNTFKEIDRQKLEQSVTPDFSSEGTAIQTIKQIIAVLDSPAYQKCAKIIDEFISSLDK